MLGAVGDYSNPPIGFRHGFEQGKPRIKGGSQEGMVTSLVCSSPRSPKKVPKTACILNQCPLEVNHLRHSTKRPHFTQANLFYLNGATLHVFSLGIVFTYNVVQTTVF